MPDTATTAQMNFLKNHITDLLEQWINGNRKHVVNALLHPSFDGSTTAAFTSLMCTMFIECDMPDQVAVLNRMLLERLA